MSVLTTCRLADPYGRHLIEIANYAKLDYVLNCAPGAVGVLEVTLPSSFDTSLLMRDGRIGVWRALDGRAPYLDNNAIYLIETFVYTSQATLVRAYHATGLMARRIIAYYATTAFTEKTAAADDLIKAFWDENAGSASEIINRDGAPNRTDLSAYISRQADLTQGVSVSKAAARRNLLEVARELAEASATGGTYLTFEIMAPTESTLELRTYATARGVDHRAGTANPIVLSEARGNLESAELIVDFHDEATFIVAGGVGEGINRLVATRPDLSVIGSAFTGSPFARIEQFVDSSNTADAVKLEQEADAALRALRHQTIFTGNLIETPGLRRGIQFDLGDILTAEHPRTHAQFDVRLDVVHETIEAGKRTVQIGLRSVT